MAKLQFKRRVLEIEFGDEKFEVAFPTVRQVENFQVGAKGEDSLTPTIDFLAALGLPKDAAYELEPTMLTEIINVLAGQKKS